MASHMLVYNATVAAEDMVTMTAGLLCLNCGDILKMVQQECMRAKNIIQFVPLETVLFSYLETIPKYGLLCFLALFKFGLSRSLEMEQLASEFGILSPPKFDIYQTEPQPQAAQSPHECGSLLKMEIIAHEGGTAPASLAAGGDMVTFRQFATRDPSASGSISPTKGGSDDADNTELGGMLAPASIQCLRLSIARRSDIITGWAASRT
ncbi:hypothetical protein F4808DRAFT_462795 [Astrocystis sublimbata]|nr:hypothetical protein F4808DRAFT_462795 [Astrocystis sublimbata]